MRLYAFIIQVNVEYLSGVVADLNIQKMISLKVKGKNSHFP